MFNQDQIYKIHWEVPIHVNGRVVEMTADGEGCAREGRLSVRARFDSRPEGFDAAVILMWTSSDSTLFGRELDGAVNLGRVTEGNYSVIRTIDMGDRGHLECAWTKRLDDSDMTIYTTGVVTGRTDVPRIKGAAAMVEDMAMAGPGVIVGRFGTTLVTEADEPIEPAVNALYSFDAVRPGLPTKQVRTASVDLTRHSDLELELLYQVEFRPAT
jgi:hypothetical protein